jgi:hypothetical protein
MMSSPPAADGTPPDAAPPPVAVGTPPVPVDATASRAAPAPSSVVGTGPSGAAMPGTSTNGGRSNSLAAIATAVVSLLLSIAALVLSGLALSRSDAASVASPKASQSVNATSASSESTAAATGGATNSSATAEPNVSASSTELNPAGAFQISYQNEHLTIRSGGCDTTIGTPVDLDEPRVNPLSGREDLTYTGCEPGSISSDLPQAEVASASSTPKDCLQNIRTAPGRSPVAPVKGMTICFVTNQTTAASQGITQKLVFVTISSLTTDNRYGVLNVSLTAWNVPN